MRGERDTGKRMLSDGRGRDEYEGLVSQGIPRIDGHHQKLGGGKKGFFPSTFRSIIAKLIH